MIAAYTIGDPTTRNTAASLLKEGWSVTVIQEIPNNFNTPVGPPGIKVITTPTFSSPFLPKQLRSLLRWLALLTYVRGQLLFSDFDLVVTFMHRPLAALPGLNRKGFRLISCIYDIPTLIGQGAMDKMTIARGWAQLKHADIIWASDLYRAQLTQRFAKLDLLPIVCHNCPPIAYVPNPIPSDDRLWLRAQLQAQGAPISLTSGSIMIRAGAIGDLCGIEDTLVAMQSLPEDHVFLLMGRPSESYVNKITILIKELTLAKRVFFWDKPSDEVWKKALMGADIGHLIHVCPEEAVANQLFAFNSSLSNYRLFNYLAVGLPIICHVDDRLRALQEEVCCFKTVRQAHLINDIGVAWTALASQKAQYQAMREAAIKAFQNIYHWENQFRPINAKIQEYAD